MECRFLTFMHVFCPKKESYKKGVLHYTVRIHCEKIKVLGKEWGESIPPITALVFRMDGTATEWGCEIFAGDKEKQPKAQQIAKLAASVAAYDKWDEVLKALKP